MKRDLTYHKLAGLIILLLLFMPLAQEHLHFIKFKALKGTYNKFEQPRFTAKSWFNKSFQDSLTNFTKLNFGFSPDLTRLHNQMLFDFFNATRSPSVVIGKKNEVYDFGHIQSYLGEDFVGETIIQKKVKDLQDIQQVFDLFNTQIIVVITPSKASFNPTYLPGKFKKENKITNYDLYQLLLHKSNLPFVNFSPVFQEWKATKPYPLYPQCGVHWSEYGATLAADSILKYIEKIKNVNLPDLEIDSVILSQQLSESDYDMGSILNLLYPIKPYPMGYPQLKIHQDANHQQLSMLSISDSYYWIWYNQVGFNNKFFKNSRFYEYYKTVHGQSNQVANIKQLNMVDEVIQSDIVLIVCSESNLRRFGFGFVEEMHFLIPAFKKRYRAMLQKFKYEIRQDANWYQSIQTKATIKQISVDSMLTLDAMYVAQHIAR